MFHKGGRSGGGYRLHKKINLRNINKFYRGKNERSNKTYN